MEKVKTVTNKYLIQEFNVDEQVNDNLYQVTLKSPLNKFKAITTGNLIQKLQKAKLPVQANVHSRFVETTTMGTVVKHTLTEVLL